jgi:hypothetical protein
MKGKIHVCVGAKGFVSTPRSVHIGPDENRASFRVTLGCRVGVEIRDEETELVLTESVDVIARSVEGGLDHDVYRNPGDFAEAMEWIGLLPGAYRIEVISDDYQDWTSDVVRLGRPGERVEVVARLRPETGRGRLLLKLKPPPGGTLKGAEVSVLIGRKDDEGLLAWARVAPHGRSEDRTSHLLPPMMPGDLHLLAWGGRVAVGRLVDFALQPDRTHEVSLQLQPGVLVRLVPPPQRSGAFVLGTAHVQLTAPDGTRLPVAWFRSRLPPLPGQRWWLMSNHEYRDELVSFGDAPRTDAVLGPYPVPQVAAEGHSAELVPNE